MNAYPAQPVNVNKLPSKPVNSDAMIYKSERHYFPVYHRQTIFYTTINN